jgi:hypothetical protein
MHPQAVFVDGTTTEEEYFLDATRSDANAIHGPMIELPENAGQRLSWLTKLDSASLTGE